MLWWCHPTLPNQPIASLSDYVIPECYAANMPYIKGLNNLSQAGKLRTNREAVDKQQRPEKEDRAKGRGKSKAKDHTLQGLVYRK